MFAALVLERDPLGLQILPHELLSWCQNFGGFAAFGLFVFVLVYLLGLVRIDKENISPALSTAFGGGVLATAAAYAVYFGLLALSAGKAPTPRALALRSNVLAVAGALALLTVSLPMFVNLVRWRPRRILAIAKLSFKEAVRRRVLYVFSLLLLVFLFASWFVPYKPEDQVRTYVSLVYYAMTPLLLFTAIILASFSIPADIKNQTIHTVLTKPVERFEVVLGRFLGYVGLMTLVLLVMCSVSLLYVLRGVDPEAANESLKAREPLYGDLVFVNTTSERKGDSVGREWDYRGYITAQTPGQKQQMAVWTFPAVSRGVADRDRVRCEFAFDVYRTTKGKENRGVSCNFFFRTWKFARGSEDEYYRQREKRLDAERKKGGGRSEWDIDNELAEEFGYYEVRSKDITDYHTQTLELPGGLFRNALDGGNGAGRAHARTAEVRCETATQYVGMARYDLYLRLDDPSGKGDTFWFALNFFKGAAGLWFRLVLVIALAVALSTYLSGVISMLIALLLYLGGLTEDFIRTVAEGTNVGGGPMESLYRLASRQAIGAPTEANPTAKSMSQSDLVSRWFIRRLLDIIPDVDHFDLTAYVAEGFNIAPGQLLAGLLLLGLYLYLWVLLAYYLMKWREIAGST
jgi:hypothetical protein